LKILAPISSVDEVEMLVANGADEIYCGIVPPEWLETFTGAIWLNRRSPVGANLTSYDSLAELVRRAHASNVPVSLALNAPSYNERQLEDIGVLAKRATSEIGVDALIVSDVGLLLTLADLGLETRIHISSIASTLNCETIEFYRELGAARVILPRSLSLREIGSLATEVGGRIELEVFILNDGCAFEEGLCHTTHHHRVGPFCWNIRRWNADACRDDGRPIGPEERQDLATHLDSYREWLWYLGGCDSLSSPQGLPYGPCGLCAVPQFLRLGITSLKIAGREASSFRKLASLRLVKTVVDHARAGATPVDVAARVRRIRNTPQMCDAGYMCYYRSQGE
jgi:putative protease